jgi:hypothetical protein
MPGIIHRPDDGDTNAAGVARVLGGVHAGAGWLCRCPVSGHGQRRGDIHPSLSVRDGETRLVFHCHAGCASLDVLAALRARGLLSGHPAPAQAVPAVEQVQRQDKDALAIWSAGKPAAGTVVETYLRRRGITIPTPTSIRCRSNDLKPTMIVAVRGSDGQVIAVQRTFLTRDGHKAPIARPRITTGELFDGAAQLGGPVNVLGLAEGVEDALAATQLSGVACWASLGAGRMHRVAVPDAVRELHIFGDYDEPGQRAADRTADHHVAAGRSVILRFPPQGFKDWASVIENNTNNRTAA